ncbi:hypothetical protein OS493_019438 [Desmophyllum pertusum]|uniref:Uncharacterized protein n=1 Tax=Desmophyllum pertusum TaxID=174260 RepID=A0A9X0D920_9CNID|nr:hypothetical protein OS493_019438 [Desmophyllum pertusum]
MFPAAPAEPANNGVNNPNAIVNDPNAFNEDGLGYDPNRADLVATPRSKPEPFTGGRATSSYSGYGDRRHLTQQALQSPSFSACLQPYLGQTTTPADQLRQTTPRRSGRRHSFRPFITSRLEKELGGHNLARAPYPEQSQSDWPPVRSLASKP